VSAFVVGALVLERYRVVQPLGSGGMGVVYLGRTEGAAGFTRPVVIKRLRAALAGEREHNDMFVREARILSNLQHPNIVGVVDFGQDDGEYVMVLEYVHGYDLDQWSQFVWREGRQHSVNHVLYIARRVLTALHYAHSLRRPDGAPANIVHRDVSLSNVLLDAQAMVKLHDFGIARMSGGGEAATETGVFKGKIGLAAPELIAGERATPQSDIYALGVVAYHLLSGSNPFRGKDAANTMFRVLNHDPSPLAARRDDLPIGLDEVLGRAMHKDAERRFADAAQFAHALGNLCGSSDEDIVEDMARQLRDDFANIPAGTQLESLASRDSAWRDAQPPSEIPPQPLSSSPPQASSSSPPLLGPDAPTIIAPQASSSSPPLRRSDLRALMRSTLPPRSRARSTEPASIGQFASVTASRLRRPSAPPRRWAFLGAGICLLVAAVVLVVTRAPSGPATRYLVIEQPPEAPPTGTLATGQLATPPPERTPRPAREGQAGSAPRNAPPRSSAARPDASTLTREFRRHQPRVESCIHDHVEQIDRHPQISVRFQVNAAGKVTGAELSPPALTNTPLGACLLGVARSVQFSPLSKPVAFSIPITARRTP
jgi:eukaryotic-like serine/threonine-protein kinase